MEVYIFFSLPTNLIFFFFFLAIFNSQSRKRTEVLIKNYFFQKLLNPIK